MKLSSVIFVNLEGGDEGGVGDGPKGRGYMYVYSGLIFLDGRK